MNYYVFPGTGIYGGIKVGFQFCDLLARLGIRIVAVTPDGMSPTWLTCNVPVIPYERLVQQAKSEDTILFSLPHDYEKLNALPANLVFHCQGTDKLILPVLANPEVTLLSCWPQAHAFMKRESGREPIDVGISISDVFFYDGRPKSEKAVLFMPRRGASIAAGVQTSTPLLSFHAIDNVIEPDCAGLMKQSGYFLGTAIREWFGLPALEAMAAGAIVVTVPVLGGSDYLVPGTNCVMAEPEQIAALLGDISSDNRRDLRSAMRQRALETAHSFRTTLQKRRIAAQLSAGLSEKFSWA